MVLFYPFVYFFIALPYKDQFAVLYFSTSLIVLIQVYNWEIDTTHWFVAVVLLTS